MYNNILTFGCLILDVFHDNVMEMVFLSMYTLAQITVYNT
jgi:hypothetical protein